MAPPGNEIDASRRYEDRSTILWTLVIYATTALGVWTYFGWSETAPSGWRLAGCVGLVVAYFLLYHLVYLPSGDEPSPRLILGYGLAQAGIVAVLLVAYSPRGFIGMGIALACQLLAVLPGRWWPVPIIAAGAACVAAFDVPGLFNAGDGGLVIAVAIQTVIWLTIFAMLIFALRQRWRLAALVEELRETQAELRRSAAQADELAILRERTRLAREMHDSLGHALVTVNVKLEVVERLYARDPARGAAELRDTRELVRQAMVDLRHSLDDLRGPLPPARDLAVDLRRELAAVGERASLATSDDIGPLPDLPPATVAALWAVLQEALRNVERHAAAGSVAVRLAATPAAITLEITDDGSGLAAGAEAKPGRHGLTGMRERLAVVGGRLTIAARPGGGTIVTATVPVNGVAAADRGGAASAASPPVTSPPATPPAASRPPDRGNRPTAERAARPTLAEVGER